MRRKALLMSVRPRDVEQLCQKQNQYLLGIVFKRSFGPNLYMISISQLELHFRRGHTMLVRVLFRESMIRYGRTKEQKMAIEKGNGNNEGGDPALGLKSKDRMSSNRGRRERREEAGATTAFLNSILPSWD
ncbi:uncharacterized protein BDCG_05764 [Blastomyces dermatitidis ER-3]|uniref:Uncharacterized protein n=2 Tax=Ajellomyces dermatitidis TaxID=5039 RepID=F2TDX8_AJEDA|nr:uncharacterized protein BDCG_05764 [Blastomyces dermatitidis ER-3]EEQ90644.2 hypothetical protein BDCG_05764 [Blastomyces dermatitidis ER-3]EGE81441.2 hypothetical protein BDDG_04383 [Blastomyces dermatitidis ATCC 18188]